MRVRLVKQHLGSPVKRFPKDLIVSGGTRVKFLYRKAFLNGAMTLRRRKRSKQPLNSRAALLTARRVCLDFTALRP